MTSLVSERNCDSVVELSMLLDAEAEKTLYEALAETLSPILVDDEILSVAHSTYTGVSCLGEQSEGKGEIYLVACSLDFSETVRVKSTAEILMDLLISVAELHLLPLFPELS